MLLRTGLHVGALCVIWWFVEGIAPSSTDDIVAQTVQLGLDARAYHIRTVDGYELSVHHVRGAGIGSPVLLVCGLLQGAGAWLNAGADGLVPLLNAAGRDVWLASVRGMPHARKHAWLDSRKDPLYWRYSIDEIGSRDLPVLIDRVLTETGADHLDLIGFSQGGAAFFIMCSELPHYCRKVNLMLALAPSSRMLHTRSITFRFLCQYCDQNEKQLAEHGLWEILPLGGLAQSFLNFICLLPGGANVCETVKDVVDGPNSESISDATLLAAAAEFPAGSSLHNMAWFGQHMTSRLFHKFDYGSDQNMVEYGSEEAPVYNLSAVTAATVIMYGRNDGIVDARDVKWLIRQLPNVRKVYEMEDPLWTHFDFVLSKNIPRVLFPKIKDMLDLNGV